jgi:hypothetical protein
MNNIDWEKVKLYHGTSDLWKNDIFNKGLYKPNHDMNWLGRGTYFTVDNIFMPILYSNNKAKETNSSPYIIEIEGKYLSSEIKTKILDLTSQKGLNLLHLITNEFVDYINIYKDFPALKEKFNLLERHFSESPFYNSQISKQLIPDLDWFVFAILSKNKEDFLSNKFKNLKDLTKDNITNVILDWYNFKVSCGNDKDVPIKGVMGNFNTGTPIALFSSLKEKLDEHGFSDYTNYLSRSEIAIFGYDLYDNGDFWNFEKLFSCTPKRNQHYKEYIGNGPILELLVNSFDNIESFGLRIDKYEINKLYNTIINERDTAKK